MIIVEGVEKTLRMLGKTKMKDAQTIEECLKDAAIIGLNKALHYVPVDQGDLRDSGKIVSSGKGFGATSSIQFGGPTAPYALIVHENPDMAHAPPTCYKYLERGIRESRGTIMSLIKRRMEGRQLVVERTAGLLAKGL